MESLRQSGVANRQITIDVNLFVAYENALAMKNQALADFISRRFPSRLKVATKAWLATHPATAAGAPSSPFAMRQYHVAAQDSADALERLAKESFNAAVQSNETANRYILLTVLFASVSFLAGVGSKFEIPNIVVSSLALSTIVLLAAVTTLVGFQVW